MNDKFKMLIFYIDRLHYTDRWFFFLVSLWNKRVWECSIDLPSLNSPKINFFIEMLSSNELYTHKTDFYFKALTKLINETPNISAHFFPLKYLDERGFFNCPSAFFLNKNETFSEPNRQLEFVDSSFIKPYTYKRRIYVDEEGGKLVYEWYRFQVYKWHDIASDNCKVIQAFKIVGDQDEIMYVHISLNVNGEIVKIVFLKSQSTDSEIGKYIMAHFRTAFIEKRYSFAKDFKAT